MIRLLARIKALKDDLFGDYASATQRYIDLIRDDRTDLKYLERIVTCYIDDDKSEESISFVNRILAVDSNNYLALITAAKYWQAQGNVENAYNFASRALENIPDPPVDIDESFKTKFNTLSKLSSIELGDRIVQVNENIRSSNNAEIEWAVAIKAQHERL